MAAGHAVRGMVTAWLGLVVLQTVSTRAAPAGWRRCSATSTGCCTRAFDPKVPAIPDRRTAAGSSPAGGTGLFSSNALHNVRDRRGRRGATQADRHRRPHLRHLRRKAPPWASRHCKYGVGLIALYIVVANGSNFGTAFSAGARGVSDVTRTFQGR
jgi:hypothetical protein